MKDLVKLRLDALLLVAKEHVKKAESVHLGAEYIRKEMAEIIAELNKPAEPPTEKKA